MPNPIAQVLTSRQAPGSGGLRRAALELVHPGSGGPETRGPGGAGLERRRSRDLARGASRGVTGGGGGRGNTILLLRMFASPLPPATGVTDKMPLGALSSPALETCAQRGWHPGIRGGETHGGVGGRGDRPHVGGGGACVGVEMGGTSVGDWCAGTYVRRPFPGCGRGWRGAG